MTRVTLDRRLNLKATLFLVGRNRHDEAVIRGELVGLLGSFVIFKSQAGTVYVVWPGSVSHIILDERIEFAEEKGEWR
jgi:hypothetical protein